MFKMIFSFLKKMDTNTIIPSPLIQQFEIQAPRGKAIDIGAGKGDNALFLAKHGFFVTAVEIRKELADTIKKRAEENQIGLEIINRDIKDFIVEENQYSFISAINSLNFFSKQEFLNIIEKIKNGLRKSGICVISLFTADDSLFEKIKSETASEDDGSFRNKAGKKWYFPKSNELRKFFEKDFEILFYKEATIDDKGHKGNMDPHQHAIARIVVKK